MKRFGDNYDKNNEENMHGEGDSRKRAKEARRLTAKGIELSNEDDERSWEKAVECFMEAIELADDPVACRVLGMAYFYAHGVEQSYEKAAGLYLRAAKMGDCEGMYRFAECLRDGLGVRRSIDEAVNWLERSARLGFPVAEGAFGCIEVYSENDDGIMEGISFLCDAAAKRDEEAQDLVRQLDDDKAVVDRSKDGEVLSIRALTKRQVELLSDGMYKVAYAYRTDPELRGTDEEVAGWLARAAHDGNSGAMCSLAFMMLNEKSPVYSPKRAVDLMFEAANLGDADAEFMVGRFYFEGFAVEKDCDEAFAWLLKAASDGSPDAKKYIVEHFD